ncbi:MAG: Gfo/Idh/MocA family oxidoreductase [Microbacterium sp.]|uniref:Dehydrogenase n=1 Tax=Microbacterium natoriense TaxID=284570 RepID=A0AAW8EW61_9MICO|nr:MULTISPECIES: Gfo/Idh/MocA family oxidoreductase [Microbacterium]MBW8762007.1 Gfo/Idh/MocA family oxidoreductase [Microbacterium sp.]MDQ0647094.1 putative dehydrogenase [Microbacterium natoriense]
MGQPHGIGIIGLGVISAQYLDTLGAHPGVRIAATADLDAARAESVAARYPGCRALSVDELVADAAVDTVINLTIPAAHADVALAALAGGKNVFGEKPLAATLPDARRVMAAAGSSWVGCAPDTVLGTGIQTARAVVDAGGIGRPVAAVATWVSAGHEAWHPHPDFYYREGGGPLFDMGPYYLTTLFHLLGPVARVSGASSRPKAVRTIGSGPRAGEKIPVEIDTHVTGILEHVGGAVSTVTFSFDGAATDAAPLEIHGETGTLSVPDPNLFEGVVRVRRPGEGAWSTVTERAGYENAGRGIGVLDRLATGAGSARGDIALHVLEIMTALTESARSGRRIDLTTAPERPALIPFTPENAWRQR